MTIMISSHSPVLRTTITDTKGAFTGDLMGQVRKPTRSMRQVVHHVRMETLAPRMDASDVVAAVDTGTECHSMSRPINTIGLKTWSIHSKVCRPAWSNTHITRFAAPRTFS